MDIATMKTRPGISGFDFTATIEKILGQYRTGEGQYGPYSFQDLMVRDETGKILVTIKNHPQLPASVVGKKIAVSCRSFNGTLRGTMVKQETDEDDNGQSQTITKIEVTKSAVIVVEQEQSPSQVRQERDPELVAGWVEAYKQSAEVLTHPEVKAALAGCVGAGWSSEDIRTLATTIVIGRSRR